MTRPGRGLSLVEVMVGLVVGLLVSLAAAKSAQWFVATQRQGVAVGGGSANAASALAAIKDDVAIGGMGFFANGGYRCAELNLSVGNGVIVDGAPFAPVQAQRVGNNDVIDVVYANAITAGAWSELQAVSDGSGATLRSMLPITAGQTPAVLLAPREFGTECLVRTVTASVAATAATKQALTFGNTGTHNQGDFATDPVFEERSPVVMLTGLQWNRYSLDGTNLVLTRRLTGATATLLRNVIALRVQYGIAPVGNTAITEWVNSDDAGWNTISAVNVGRVRAIRIGVLLRSAQREKADEASGTCQTTSAKPQLFEGADAVEIEPDVTDWKCYRYRSSVVIAPLRNLVHGTETITWPENKLP